MRSETEGDDELNESLSNMKIVPACSTAAPAAACDDEEEADDSCKCGCDTRTITGAARAARIATAATSARARSLANAAVPAATTTKLG